ncbi:MAG: molybdopterin-dependent oxidoreductase [Clostridiales Family XIII bacterium]|jgi:aldehyde oxidoreductase|nr:molybdopterin-dependent oxidoreductase [Clostridiales Family XIII bacterium]
MDRKTLIINGTPRSVLAHPGDSLAAVIRGLGLLGTKISCGGGQCGACSVILDGKVVRSCVYKFSRVPEGARITTIEGIGTPERPGVLQKAFTTHGCTQCGFCIPGFIVSAAQLLMEELSPTRETVREWFRRHRNVCRCTGYRPIVDAVMTAAAVLRGELPEDVLDPHTAEEGRIWNTSYPRPTALAKATGTLEYGADLGTHLPDDTLRLALAQATVSHARILSIDTSEAEQMEGVVRVLTHKDVKGNNRIFGFVLYPWSKNDGFDRPILCDEKVFQFGDAIAIVCADTEAHARAAAAAVKVEYEVLPAYMNALEAADPGAMEIHPGTPNVFFTQNLIKGDDVEKAFEKAHVVVEGDYYVQRQPHLALEPDVGFAYVDSDGVCVIQSKSISLYSHRTMIAEGLGLPQEKIRIIQNPMGGSFGYKLSPTLEALCAVATLATGRPCYLGYDYYQSITYTGKRSPAYFTLKAGADKNGKLTALKSDFYMDHGAYSEFGDLLTIKIIRNITAGYDIPNNRGVGRCVFTNHAFGSAFRGYGSPQAEFASESLMDQVAEALGMDPWEFRYKNVYRPGATTPTGDAPDVYPLPALLEMAKPKYDALCEDVKKRGVRAEGDGAPHLKYGMGIAIGVYNVSRDSNDAAGSDIELHPDGSVTIYNTWEDHGQGADIGSLGTAHEALRPLGLTPDQIHLCLNDTALCPNSGPAAASRCQYVVGNAIIDSANKLLDAMRKEDGTYRTYDEMVAEGLPVKYSGSFATGSICEAVVEDTLQFRPVPTYMYGVFLTEVEVDTKTGKTKVLSMEMFADVGVVGNRLAVEGQLLGGMAQGVGLALKEDFEDLEKHTTMVACGIPYIDDIPDDLSVTLLETPRASGPFGAAGCGELPLTAPHPAIIGAIYRACGARVTHLPALPEKVLAAMPQ